MIDRAALEEARARLTGIAYLTPTVPARWLSDLVGGPVFLKCENLQRTGSFKIRGAYNRIAGLSDEERALGVMAASAGNHAQGVALHAQRLGVPATIVMPRFTPSVKVEATRAFGPRIVLEGETLEEARELGAAMARDEGLTFVHPYDDPLVIAGQGTVALEMLQDAPPLDALLVAVGGGGLIGGMAAWLEAAAAAGARVPKLIAVESEGCPTLSAALAAGRIVEVAPRGLAVDSLGARRVGERMFPLAQRRVARSVLVPDAAIAAAQAALWRQLRIATEPGGATAFAALASGAWRPADGERVGVLVCGANVDLRALADTVDATA